MQKTKFFLIINIIVLSGVFALFFISLFTPKAEVLAQNEDKIIVDTTHYSILSPSIFILGGAYSGNLDKKGLTTYFEYKKYDSSDNDSNNLDVEKDREITIPTVQKTEAEEFGYFYSSPSLKLFSTYYFRAVGCFDNGSIDKPCYKDNSSPKFYGNTLSFRTGFPFQMSLPFTMGRDGVARAYIPPTTCDPKKENLINGICVKKTPPPLICKLPKVLDTSTNTCITPPPPLPPTSDTTSTDSSTSLVKCGIEKYPEGHPKSGLLVNPCGFLDFMKLVNGVINFILYYMAVPVAAIMFFYAGFELVTSGGSTEKRGTAKKVFTNAVYGLVFAAGAWLIVKTLLSILGYTDIGTFFN